MKTGVTYVFKIVRYFLSKKNLGDIFAQILISISNHLQGMKEILPY